MKKENFLKPYQCKRWEMGNIYKNSGQFKVHTNVTVVQMEMIFIEITQTLLDQDGKEIDRGLVLVNENQFNDFVDLLRAAFDMSIKIVENE